MMKTFLLATASLLAAGAALAADLPSRRAPPVAYAAPPVFTWTGFYAGTLTGYAWGGDQTIRTVGNNDASGGLTNTRLNVAQFRRPPALGIKQDGMTSIGGGGGYDHQFGLGSGIVVGIAADATLMDLERRRVYRSPAQASNAFTPELSGFRQSLDYLGTVRGRIGYAYDRFLIYGTGGFAFGGVDYRASFLNNAALPSQVYAGRFNDIKTGYVYGGGIEYAIPTDSFLNNFNLLKYVGVTSQAVTVKVEYLRYDLGHQNVLVANTLPAPTGSYTTRFNTEGNLIRGGLTYRFGGLGL